jgi:hypothetical protein
MGVLKGREPGVTLRVHKKPGEVRCPMLSPQELYPLVYAWLQAMGVAEHAAVRRALAHLVVALLHGQSLRPARLMRALLSPVPVPARQRYKRLARFWARPWLAPAWLRPRLVRAVLALVPPEAWGPSAGATHVVLDSVRCGPWEVFTLGVAWRGRVVPLHWAVLPYPWPPKAFTPTVCRLVEEVAAVWPAGRPAHLVADRAFPSLALLRTLRRARWGWTLRLGARSAVRVGAEALLVRALLDRSAPQRWTVWAAASYGWGARREACTLVVGRGLQMLPAHQRTAGSLRHRAARQAERQRVKGYRYAVAQTDAWVALCTTHPTWRAAVWSYRRRWSIEGSYRDAQSGWDGQQGWDLEPVLSQARSAAHAERVVGLWALGSLIQTWIGVQVAHGAPAVQAVAAQWTTTGRLSVWAQGRFALHEPSAALQTWLVHTLREGARCIASAGPPWPQHTPVPIPVVRRKVA